VAFRRADSHPCRPSAPVREMWQWSSSAASVGRVPFSREHRIIFK
jgi:hypothetical protein